MAISTQRLRSLSTISLVNALVIFSTLFSDWTLTEATLAYLGELVLLVLVVFARVLVAKRLPDSTTAYSRWKLVGAKMLAIGISLLLYGFVVGAILMLLFGKPLLSGAGIHLPESTVRGLLLCWAGFFAIHLLGFMEQFRRGIYDELIADSRVMAQLWRYPPLLLAGIAIALTNQDGLEIAPWFFVAALAFMAIVDAGTYISEQDAVNTAVRRARWLERRRRELV
jgi:hypothetical protein